MRCNIQVWSWRCLMQHSICCHISPSYLRRQQPRLKHVHFHANFMLSHVIFQITFCKAWVLLVQACGLHIYSVYFCWGTLHSLQQYLWPEPADLVGSPWGFGPGREQYWGHWPDAVPGTLLQAEPPDSGGQPYLSEAKCRICRGEDLVCTYCVNFWQCFFSLSWKWETFLYLPIVSFWVMTWDTFPIFHFLLILSFHDVSKMSTNEIQGVLVKTQACFLTMCSFLPVRMRLN